MSTTAPTRPARRPVSMSGTTLSSARPSATTPQNPSGTTLVAKGSISRASPTPKATPLVRRSTASSRPSSSLSNSRDGGKDAVSAKPKDSLGKDPLESKDEGDNAQDTTNTDELRIRIQDLDSTVSALSTENTTLQTALTRAETRLTELYADQARTDEELGMRHELAEKLRSQIRELEKEKRDVTRRYNEQTNAFEAERQSFYDNEQHLKSRIQALSQSKKQEKQTPVKSSRHLDTDSISIVSEVEYPPPSRGSTSLDGLKSPKNRKQSKIANEADNSQEESGDDTDTPEMIALKLELSTLSTSHNSLQSTLHLLQTQLLDLQRVNAELQEENEGWKVLVQQRTLAGTFDVLSLGGANQSAEESSSGGDETSSTKNSNRNTLGKVSEMDEIAYEAGLDNANGIPQSLAAELQTPESARGGRPLTLESELFSADTSRDDSPASKRSRRRGTITAGEVKGESLADLPLTGPGLDLAAELGRAQNAEGFITNSGDQTNDTPKKLTASELQSKAEIEGLKTEVKNLKEANKALSLYASKIIDRIIATEGFENVLAVDFHEKVAAGNKTTPTKSKPKPASLSITTGTAPVIEGPRTALPKEKLTTFESIGLSGSGSTPSKTTTATPQKQAPPSPMPSADPKRSRRSMSFDWRGFSLFGGQSEADKKVNDPSLRPLTLRPGAPSWTTNSSSMNARKLETTEDDEDRKERERMRATMRLMGIDPDTNNQRPMVLETSQPPTSRPISTSSSNNAVNKLNGTSTPPSPKTATPNPSNRWSFFGRKNTNDTTLSASGSSSSLAANNPTMATAPLTTEALQQAEAEQHIAALEAREQVVKEEIAKGGSSGFTELAGANGAPRRRIGEEWRSRRNSTSIGGLEVSRSQSSRKAGSSAGSASTVWSAGKDDD